MPALENEQHERFCNEFLIDFNQTQAAIRAKYSAKSARKQASDLMTRPDIAGRIKELNDKALAKVDVDVYAVLLELKRLAYCDVQEALNPMDGTLLPINEIPIDVRKCIASFQMEELWAGPAGERVQIGVIKKVKFWDKTKCLELLGKYLKMFTDRVEHSADSSLEALIVASMLPKDSK